MMLISFLRHNLQEYRFTDTLIVKVAVQEARNGLDVAVHADDVDVLWRCRYY